MGQLRRVQRWMQLAQNSPGDPTKCHESLHAVAVEQVGMGAVLPITHRRGDGTGTSHEEEPRQSDPETMSGNRSKGTADTSQEEDQVDDGK